MTSPLPQRRIYQFGDFELQVNARLLMRDGKRVPVGSKAFEVLTCLVAHAGEVVTKEQLLKTVWPNSFVEESNLSQHVFALRKALGDRADLIATVPGRGYQFTGAVRELAVADTAVVEESETVVQTLRERSHMVIEEAYILAAPGVPKALPAEGSSRRGRLWLWGVGGLAALLLLGFAGWEHFHRTDPGEVHKLMVADFQNATGDAAFDRTLKRALEIELGQSPSLNVMGAGEAVSLLRLMGQKPDAALTGDVAREVCVRGNRQMLLSGAIATVGHAYLLTLEATACQSGRKLASAKAQAASKDEVLGALDQIADRVRSKLGEPAKSLEAYQVPISEATTSSLEALKAYSVAVYMQSQGRDETELIESYKRAVELDPNFSMAWGGMASAYYNLNEFDVASEYFKKAFDLSDKVSTHERLILRAHYFGEGVNDEVEAVKAYQLWASTYPGDWAPLVNICNSLTQIGQYGQALPACRAGLAMAPEARMTASVLARALKDSNQFDEALRVGADAVRRGKDSTGVHASLYEIALLRRDRAALDREAAWAATHGDSWYRWNLPYLQGSFALAGGRYREGAAALRRAEQAAEDEDLAESRRDCLQDEAMMEFQLGLTQAAQATLARIPAGMVETADSALLRAEMGDTVRAERFLAAHQADAHPGTMMAYVSLPAIRAVLALHRDRPAEAVEDLEPAIPYELATYTVPSLRAAAYLKAGEPGKAAEEYRKILANPGVNAVSPLYPLAHLGLARADAAAGNPAESRAEYRGFLETWKDADPELPPLKAAKLELARLDAGRLGH